MNWEWLIPLISAGASAVVTGVIGFLVKRSLDKFFAKKDAEAKAKELEHEELQKLKEEKQRKERKADIEEIVFEFLTPIKEDIAEIRSTQELETRANLSALRNDILTCYYKCADKGYRNDYDYQNIHHLYEAYEDLKGNSFIADIMNRFDALPVKEDTVPTKTVARKRKKTILVENK